MPNTHPDQSAWAQFVTELGFGIVGAVAYVNDGAIGHDTFADLPVANTYATLNFLTQL
jgi:hypothetical protein